MVQQLAASPEVWLVELDQVMRAVGGEPEPERRRLATQTSAPWNLDRIDGARSGSEYWYPDGMGTGSTVFVVDTGVRASHVDFGGRAVSGTDFVAGTSTNDCHGTSLISLCGVAL